MSKLKKYVVCKVGLDHKVNNYMNNEAFAEGISVNDLLKRHLILGARMTLKDDLEHQARVPKAKRIPQTVLVAAREANLLPRKERR